MTDKRTPDTRSMNAKLKGDGPITAKTTTRKSLLNEKRTP